MIKVGVNGYGTIGRRVASAVLRQPDMELVGITKVTPDYRVEEALSRGIKVFAVSDTGPLEQAGYHAAGIMKDLLAQSNVVVDCSPKGKGKENLSIYSSFPGLKAIFQGGERHDLAGVSFNSDCSYEQAKGKKAVRVVSCNTTALCRVISALNTSFQVKKVRATLVRRSADQSESDSSIFNSWAPDTGFPSHHSQDVRTVIPGVSIASLAGIAPMTLMHGHMLFIELENRSRRADTQAVIEALQRNPRIMLCGHGSGLTSTAKLKDLFALDGNRNGDLYEVCIWKEGIGVDDSGEIGLHMAIDQQADVVPENIDAIRALCTSVDRAQSQAITNRALGIGRRSMVAIQHPLAISARATTA